MSIGPAGRRPSSLTSRNAPDRESGAFSSLYSSMHLIVLAGFIAGLLAFSETGRSILASCLGVIVIAAVVIGGIILLSAA